LYGGIAFRQPASYRRTAASDAIASARARARHEAGGHDTSLIRSQLSAADAYVCDTSANISEQTDRRLMSFAARGKAGERGSERAGGFPLARPLQHGRIARVVVVIIIIRDR